MRNDGCILRLRMILETLQKAIDDSDKTRAQIAAECGVSKGQLTRLMQGRSLYCETADILLAYFGYDLRKKKGAKP